MFLVVFDVDGTLVDSQDLVVAAQRETFLAHGLEPPGRERALSIVGLSLPQAFRVLADEAIADSLAEGYRRAFGRLRADPGWREPLFPGAAELLAELARRPDVALGIATGKSRRGVAHLLEREGWQGVFATIKTADDAPSKPHPAMLEQALAKTGVAPGCAAMVGDSTFDMVMARAAGLRPIAVSWGYHRPDALREAGAETIVESYADLRAYLFDRVLGSQPGAAMPILPA